MTYQWKSIEQLDNEYNEERFREEREYKEYKRKRDMKNELIESYGHHHDWRWNSKKDKWELVI